MFHDNGRILSLTACVKYPWGGVGSETIGGHQGKLEGELQGFLPPSPDSGCLFGRGVPSEGPHIVQAPGTSHVSTFEGASGNFSGRSGPFTTVPNL